MTFRKKYHCLHPFYNTPTPRHCSVTRVPTFTCFRGPRKRSDGSPIPFVLRDTCSTCSVGITTVRASSTINTVRNNRFFPRNEYRLLRFGNEKETSENGYRNACTHAHTLPPSGVRPRAFVVYNLNTVIE